MYQPMSDKYFTIPHWHGESSFSRHKKTKTAKQTSAMTLRTLFRLEYNKVGMKKCRYIIILKMISFCCRFIEMFAHKGCTTHCRGGGGGSGYGKMSPDTNLPPSRRHHQDKKILPPPLQCMESLIMIKLAIHYLQFTIIYVYIIIYNCYNLSVIRSIKWHLH